MDISALSSPLNLNLSTDVQVAVLKKNLDTMEQTGEGLIKIMESSLTPNLGQNIDYYV